LGPPVGRRPPTRPARGDEGDPSGLGPEHARTPRGMGRGRPVALPRVGQTRSEVNRGVGGTPWPDLAMQSVAHERRVAIAALTLIAPSEGAVVLVDYQAGLAFAAGSADRQSIRSAALALAKTAVAFSVPVVVSTSATKVYSGPLMPPLRAVLTDVVPIERRNMNLW